jgi:hypothetical protein
MSEDTLLTDNDRHGKQGVLNTASNSQLENEFGTKKEEDVVKQILEKGDIQTSEVCCFYVPVDMMLTSWLCRTPSARATPTTPRAPCRPTKRRLELLTTR